MQSLIRSPTTTADFNCEANCLLSDPLMVLWISHVLRLRAYEGIIQIIVRAAVLYIAIRVL